MYGGYTCVKGRAQPEFMADPARLLRSLKRAPDGEFHPIPVMDALDEIAERLLVIRDRYGPRAIAGYWGTMATGILGGNQIFTALLDLLGTPMEFGPSTIDKGGKQVAASALGTWMAPSQGFDRPNAVLLLGSNPLLTYTGFPNGSPGVWLRDSLKRGMKLIVIDPRRSDVAEKAHLHLRALPGHDPEILASMIKVVLDEQIYDREFVADNVIGVDELREAVAGFTPARVADLAGLDADDIVAAARMFAGAGRGYAFAGTGPSMSARGSLVEYLVLALETLCGHWLRAGEPVAATPTLLPTPDYRAQATSPRSWSTGVPIRVRGLMGTTAGMPTGALADEILLPGEGQVRALLCWNGNPALAFPDQSKVFAALRSLDLLVHIDPFMTPTAKLADYVIAPTMALEAVAATHNMDSLSMRATGYGSGRSYANYSPAIVAPPRDSDLIDEWRFFTELYDRIEPALIAAGQDVPSRPAFTQVATADELVHVLSEGSRIPVQEVIAKGHGDVYPDASIVVKPKQADWDGHLDVGNPILLADLAEIDRDGMPVGDDDGEFPFRLLCRRVNHVYNTSCNFPSTNRGRPYNPAFMHPDDLAVAGLHPGDLAQLRSSLASIPVVVDADAAARRGTIAMSFGYGGGPDSEADVLTLGSSPNRLIRDDEIYDPYIGQPRMSNVPVAITRLG